MAATGGAGRAYLDRLQLAVDVRLIDDVRRWPALAQLSTRIVDRIRDTAQTRRRVFDELSTEERLLHAVAQALGGQLDDREARTIHDQTSDTDRDVPFVAIVLASRGFDTERARSVYLLALEDRLSPALEDSLRMAFEHGFPPARADRLPVRVRNRLLDRWPDTTWSRLVRALSGSDHELAHLAIDQPELAASAGPRAIEVLAAHGRWRQLLERLDAGTAGARRARLSLLAGAAAWRYPLPARPIGAALATSSAATEPLAVQLALATGDSAAAIRLARATELQATDLEAAYARGLALLGGEVDDVRVLGMAMPAFGTTNASTVGTIHAALFALDLGDRAALRELSTPLGAVRETVWGRVLLARVYLGMGEPSLVEPLLFRDDGPVAALLRARALAMLEGQRDTALAWLRDLFLEYPGWSELRLRYGLALAASDPRRGVAILEEAPPDDADTAVLGPPSTARALAQLAAAELARRAGRTTDIAMRLRVALALAPSSPAVARQATTIAVAVRDGDLARQAHQRLKMLAPNARIVERLAAAILELGGEVDRAIETYRSIDAWDRVLVLSARGRTGEATLPDLAELAESSSVAALHAVAVLAARRGDLDLAGSALERAVARRPDHAGLAADFVAVRLQIAQSVLADGDVADLFYAARQLERAATLVDDARLRTARANVVIAMTQHWIRLGELDRARPHLEELRDQLDPRRDSAPHALVGTHLAALALRDRRPDDARHELDHLPATDHVRLLRAVLAVFNGDDDALDELMPELARSPSPPIRVAAQILDKTMRSADQTRALADWALTVPASEGPAVLGVEVALWLAYLLSDGGIAHDEVASYLERVADFTSDPDGARRARLAALGLRATATVPMPTDIESLDLGQLAYADERELAIGLIALEVRRRRLADDRAAAHQALSRLVMLVRPMGAVGVLALASIEDAAEAALLAWRSEPESESLQAALATQLRCALARELGDHSDAECLAIWHSVVGLLAPVLVSQPPWEMIADLRQDVYVVPYMDLDGARAACQRRIDDILVTLGKWHAARGKDAARAVARIDEVRHLLATELSIARTVETLLDAHFDLLEDAFPQPLGPLGLDLLGHRARAVEALGEIVSSEFEHATAAADVRGVLAGALLDGWIALHDGRLDVAEQVARDRISSQGRAETEAIRLLAALYIRRIREALEETDLNSAGEIASEWVTRERLPELPDELADEIANVCRGIYDRYGLNPARRRLQQVRGRAGHDTRTLRDVEAELIMRYLDRGRAADAMDRTRLLVEAMTLSPSETTRTRLHEQLAVTLAATKEPEAVDALLALLAETKLADCVVAVQVRKSELGDRRLRSSGALEARVEELRRLIDVGRSAGAPLGRLLDRLVFLHERLQQVYETAGNPHEAQRHQRRATAYRNWHASDDHERTS